MPAPTIDELVLADDPARWARLGFAVRDGCCTLGACAAALPRRRARARDPRLVAARRRQHRARRAGDDPLATAAAGSRAGASQRGPRDRSRRRDVAGSRPQRQGTAGRRPAAAADPRGADPRGRSASGFLPSRRGDPRVGPGARRGPRARRSRGPAGRAFGVSRCARRIWSVTAGVLGEHVGSIRPAVQPGRQIATLRRSAGLAIPVAFMSEPVRA